MKDPIRVTTLTRIWKEVCRFFRPSEWAIWLLGLKRSTAKPNERGLILIQIDGLSKSQMKRAVESGRMPFLSSLLDKENYSNHDFYSGLPSSTPAVQGELYYGVPTAVPAFGFRDHRTGHLVRMFANDIAAEVENDLSKGRPGLLTDGSSYCNIYGGGAKDVHFCATSFGWSEFLNTANPFKIFLVMLLNSWMFIRVLGLMALEVFLATFGFFRGIFSGKRFWQELIMIPARVVVVVLLRSLVTIGTCYDSARGQPIIHLNLLGYDEQAHRRGPGSRFAHWALRGIDREIKRIWYSAHHGAGREYDIWIFSDHGQEETRPYEFDSGELIQHVVAKMVDGSCEDTNEPIQQVTKRLPTRANWMGIGWLVSVLFGEQDHDIQTRSRLVQTVTSGPVGFVYLLDQKAKGLRDDFALRLAEEANVPMTIVVYPDQHSPQAKVFTSRGQFVLPRDAEDVFGAEHPFLQDISDDMIRMASHKNAGDIVLIGWNRTKESTSFVLQNGAHAGPGSQETHGFALLPSDTFLPKNSRPYLRPNDLRLAAIGFLDRDSEGRLVRKTGREPDAPIRVMTYNVHACVGMDGQLSPDRIARVIAQSDADIICLQELDVFRRRSGHCDQAKEVARHLEMRHEFRPAWHLEEEQFGNAILTKLPMRVVKSDSLHQQKPNRSKRSAIWVEIDIDTNISLQLINTHLSIYPTEQLAQATQLVDDWITPAMLQGPVVFCGDFNAGPKSPTHQRICKTLRDIESYDSSPTRSTLFSPFPISRVDHIFVSPGIQAMNNQVMRSRLAKIASDHLPLMSELSLSEVPSSKNRSTSANSIQHDT